MLPILDSLDSPSIFIIGAFSGAIIASIAHTVFRKKTTLEGSTASYTHTIDLEKNHQPSLIIDDEGLILESNTAFQHLKPAHVALDLLNHIQHFFPKYQHKKGCQGPFLLFNHEMNAQQQWRLQQYKITHNQHQVKLMLENEKDHSFFSNETLSTLRQILYHLSLNTQLSTRQMSEDIARLENMHDFRTERAQYLARQFELEPNNLELYFSQYHIDKVISRLDKTKASLHNKLLHWSQPSPQMLKKSGVQTAPIPMAQFSKQLISSIQNTPSALQLIQLGQVSLHCLSTDATTSQTKIQFKAPYQHLIDCLCDFYQLLALPNCDLLGLLDCNTQQVPVFNVSLHLIEGQLKLAIENIILDPQGGFHVSVKHDLTQSSETSGIFSKGILSLLDLQLHFGMKISMSENSHNKKNNTIASKKTELKKKGYENNYQIGTATLLFPITVDPIVQPCIRATHSDTGMREAPLSHELLASLSEDIDYIKLKDNRNSTVH